MKKIFGLVLGMIMMASSVFANSWMKYKELENGATWFVNTEQKEPFHQDDLREAFQDVSFFCVTKLEDVGGIIQEAVDDNYYMTFLQIEDTLFFYTVMDDGLVVVNILTKEDFN